MKNKIKDYYNQPKDKNKNANMFADRFLTNDEHKISDILYFHSLKAILVGGFVRDFWIKKSNQDDKKEIISKDIDIEVHGNIHYEDLDKIFSKFGKTDLVGKQFGVLKFKLNGKTDNNLEYDISLPRRENNIGVKHTDLEVVIDGELSYKDAFRRRDFTMNAIGFDIEKREFIDPYNGINDIGNGVIKAVDNYTFIEDPLRVYRAIQFSSRFNMNIHSDTYNLLKRMVKNDLLENLSKERISEEFNKIFLKSEKPSVGFKLMNNLNIISKYFSELEELKNKKFNDDFNQFEHSLALLDRIKKTMPKNIKDKKIIIYMYSALCINMEDEKISSFLKKITNDIEIKKEVPLLVKNIKKPNDILNNNKSLGYIKRLAEKIKLKDLIELNKAYNSLLIHGFDSENSIILDNIDEYNYLNDLIKKNIIDLRKNEIYKESNIFNGEDLKNLGVKPGKEFGEIIKFIHNEQLEGRIQSKEEAIKIINKTFFNNSKEETMEI